MVVVKEEIMSILNELPEDASFADIQIVILEKILPSPVSSSQKVQKKVLKLKKISRELRKLIKEAELNPKYLEEKIPIERVRQSIAYRRDLFFG